MLGGAEECHIGIDVVQGLANPEILQPVSDDEGRGCPQKRNPVALNAKISDFTRQPLPSRTDLHGGRGQGRQGLVSLGIHSVDGALRLGIPSLNGLMQCQALGEID